MYSFIRSDSLTAVPRFAITPAVDGDSGTMTTPDGGWQLTCCRNEFILVVDATRAAFTQTTERQTI